MRNTFANELLEHARKDSRIVLLTGDLGYKTFDQFKKELPDQYVNCGSSEQAMLGIAVGMALSGKKVFVYTITPFFLRAYETIKLYMDHELIPVCLIGNGRDEDYGALGFSHYASDMKYVMEAFKNIHKQYPDKRWQVVDGVRAFLSETRPKFISLTR